jgi:dTDP-4-dehydrorhamnose 3,5-epimerase
MRFSETPIPGVFVIELEPACDPRGWFARVFSRDEFRERGLAHEFPEVSISFNRRSGTLRGMHYQAPPSAECKLVRCSRGRVFDSAVDLRADSPACRQWFALELAPEDGKVVYVPEGVAHGFQTLVDDSELTYLISSPHAPRSARGLRWNDPAIGIEWPFSEPTVISDGDRLYPDLDS